MKLNYTPETPKGYTRIETATGCRMVPNDSKELVLVYTDPLKLNTKQLKAYVTEGTRYIGKTVLQQVIAILKLDLRKKASWLELYAVIFSRTRALWDLLSPKAKAA